MKLELEVYSSLCSTRSFVINGIIADSDDFGSKCDEDSDEAEPYGCGDMQFTRKPPTDDLLVKYGISEQEYEEVASILEERLSFGCCGWCV